MRTGTVTKGSVDINDGGMVIPGAILGGSYSALDPSTGRGTASLTINGGQAQNFSYYQVSSQEMIQVSIDQVSTTSPLTLTSVLKGASAGAGFTNVALRGRQCCPNQRGQSQRWEPASDWCCRVLHRRWHHRRKWLRECHPLV